MKRLLVTVRRPSPLSYANNDVRYQRARPRVIVIVRVRS